MPIVKTPLEGEINYEVKGEGEPVFLVSGLGGVIQWWNPQIEAFAAKYKLVLHDHRGTGRSSKNRMTYTVPLLAEDLVALMDHLKIDKAHIVGHSTGAAMAQAVALNHPTRVASVVLSGGWPVADQFFQRSFETRRALLLNCGVETYVKSGATGMFPPWWLERNWPAILANEPAAIAAFPPPEVMLARMDAICSWSPGERLAAINCPTLVTCARDDMVTPLYYSEAMARIIPGARSHYFQLGGHGMTVTMADDFNRVIPSFIDAVVAGRAWSGG
jgi:aminoacrylate hydrolase